ncbi:hypothetical protein MLD38_011893 [Melastoma candidum]|uniref:Uncharacterized protein n=1 Tax=Melastoma candidum TaxID=119954 RepID=A0ACB9R8Q2_9MYRT|nr:hypothetical protein MLD38_011893 [Melastoma candidum]
MFRYVASTFYRVHYLAVTTTPKKKKQRPKFQIQLQRPSPPINIFAFTFLVESNQNPKATMATSTSSIKRKRPSMIHIPGLLLPLKVATEDVPPCENVAHCCRYERGVAVLSIKGRKKFMEDAYRIVSSVSDLGHLDKHFFGVYDGHGGREAVDFVAQRLHQNVVEMVGGCECDTDFDVEEAIKAGFLRTDQEFLDLDLSSGACCVTALIRRNEIAISNLGDCRAVLCRGEAAEPLTRDHRAGQEEEKRRIEEKGGFVEMHRGTWRVHGVLSISRSIGDSHLKQWITSEPETRIIPLTTDLEFLILASDGLWEQVSNQEAVDVVNRLQSYHKKTREAEEDNGNGEEYGLVSVSPSSKLRRVSLKQPAGCSTRSPSCRKLDHSRKDVEEDSPKEFDSPPMKMRRISMVKRLKTRTEQASKDNIGSNDGLVAACKELVNLAVSRGSMDDITVMIIDLHHFR